MRGSDRKGSLPFLIYKREAGGIMRKAQHTELLNMVKTLQEAQEQIRVYLEKRNCAMGQDLLIQCQEAMVTIGNTIESLEGEDVATIEYAQAYCDEIYQIYQELKLHSNDVNPNKIAKVLKKALLRVENSIKNDIHVKKEVVFFPYKASMWDSLESVYLRMKANQNCEAYCVPIPYYDRNADGSLGQMHFEGGQYPKNIEVIDWQSYNLEERKPDEIYIHNPYDDWNRVTCVHPRYFSANLKKYTEKLVYIPYFILDEIEPDDGAAIEKMKHFCFLPGIVNADQVIVQSEKMKEIYVNEYLKAAKTNGLQGKQIDRSYLKEKFLGTGSPKLDKIKNTRKEELEIPQEWLRLIEKPDGSWKKIVFYNVSIASFLDGNERMLEKMKYVFEVFKERQDEVTLLWRPHPLLKSTILSMRPQLWTAYEELVKQYIEEGWGIYDDTADLDRAVLLSDAYYGDGSSVVQVYQQTGKPIMIQDVTVKKGLEKEAAERSKVMIEDAIFFENKVWCYSRKLNYLLAFDVRTSEVTFCQKVPYKREGKERLYASMKEIDGKIYLIPFYAKKMMVFDIKKELFSEIELDEDVFKMKQDGPFFMAVESYARYLYVFPAYSKFILRVDTDTNEVAYISGWEKEIEEFSFEKNDGYFRRQVVLLDDKMYVPFCTANAVLELDCVTMKYKIHQLGQQNMGYSGIGFDGKAFWLSARKGDSIVKWVPHTGDMHSLENRGAQSKSDLVYVGIMCFEDRVYAFTNKNEERTFGFEDEHVIVEEAGYSLAKTDENLVMIYQTSSGILAVIDKINHKKFEINIAVDKEMIDAGAYICSRKMVITEGNDINIQNLMDVLLQAA